jgi:UDP-N-acetylglucosamine 2-epimerase (non-hydrolysing)/UDP-GlcNAc3NAcA epimerase
VKIASIVGARPQFIKAAAISRTIRTEVQEVLVHTGQHYDSNMSDIFFEELNIPIPDYNLKVGSGSHALQIGNMMIGIEEILIKENPDMVMIYGDTNSTLAGALSAVKLNIPIVHVEAGLRSFNLRMPEEQNRILADRVSSVLLCPTNTACENLYNEGIKSNIYNIGDVMCDALLYYSKYISSKSIESIFSKITSIYDANVEVVEKWYLATIHRAENTDDIRKIKNILEAFEKLDKKVIFPVHPRTLKMVVELDTKYRYRNIIFTKPIGYLEMLYLTKNACKVVTDSGGLQKECYIMKTPCITVRNETEWVETLDGKFNILCNPVTEDIITNVNTNELEFEKYKDHYGDGKASEKALNILKDYFINDNEKRK